MTADAMPPIPTPPCRNCGRQMHEHLLVTFYDPRQLGVPIMLCTNATYQARPPEEDEPDDEGEEGAALLAALERAKR